MRILAALLLAATLSAAPTTLKVRLKPAVSNVTVEMPLEKYVAAVLAG